MKKSKFIVLIMVVFSMSLGGCSFFNGQSANGQTDGGSKPEGVVGKGGASKVPEHSKCSIKVC